MKKWIVLSIFGVALSLLANGMLIYITCIQTGKIKALQQENSRINEDILYLVSRANYNESEIVVSDKRISILEKSIGVRDKRWAKIKQVRNMIQKEIEFARPESKQNIDEITTIASAIIDQSDQLDVPLSLVAALVRTESAYNPLAVSPTGAQGLMQLVPSTAEEVASDIGKRSYDIFRISDNIQLGTRYMWKMLKRFHGDQSLAIRSYNCGPIYVEKVQAGIYPDYPEETKKYLELVQARKKVFEDAGL
jgi:soluble lytic murein transglycosylase-like protein